MATITVRNLDPVVQQRLRQRAAEHGRSMEAEVRAILRDAVEPVSFAGDWLRLAAAHRGEDLELPDRAVPRAIDLS